MQWVLTVEKMGTKRSILTDEKGLPLSVVLSRANTHDINLLEATLDKIIIMQNLCLDAGYTGSVQAVESYQYTVHMHTRSEERAQKERNPDFKARRWMVEVSYSFLTVFASCSFVLRKRLTTILLRFSLPALLLSGVSLFLSIVNLWICTKSYNN